MYRKIISHKKFLCVVSTKNISWYDDLPGMLRYFYRSERSVWVPSSTIFVCDTADWDKLLLDIQPDLFSKYNAYVVCWQANFAPDIDLLGKVANANKVRIYLLVSTSFTKVSQKSDYKSLKLSLDDINIWLDYWNFSGDDRQLLSAICVDNWSYARSLLLLAKSGGEDHIISEKSVQIDSLLRALLSGDRVMYGSCLELIHKFSSDDIPLLLWHLHQLSKMLANEDVSWYYANLLPKFSVKIGVSEKILELVWQLEFCYKKQNDKLQVQVKLVYLLNLVFDEISKLKIDHKNLSEMINSSKVEYG